MINGVKDGKRLARHICIIAERARHVKGGCRGSRSFYPLHDCEFLLLRQSVGKEYFKLRMKLSARRSPTYGRLGSVQKQSFPFENKYSCHGNFHKIFFLPQSSQAGRKNADRRRVLSVCSGSCLFVFIVPSKRYSVKRFFEPPRSLTVRLRGFCVLNAMRHFPPYPSPGVR